MRCSAARQMLAVYRDLDEGSRKELDAHVLQCSGCAAILRAYQRQDAALAGLPAVAPRRAWSASVRERTVAAGRPDAAGRRRWVLVTALAAALFLGASAGTIGAADRALPGDWLYPVKREVEQVRLSLMRDEAQRTAYMQAIRTVRLEEARAVVASGREAVVEFEGRYEGGDAGEWSLEALDVGVPADVWTGEQPAVGSAVSVRANAHEGTLQATQVQVYGSTWPVAGSGAGSASAESPDPGAGSAPGGAAAVSGPAVLTAEPAEPNPPAPHGGAGRGTAGGGDVRPIAPVAGATQGPEPSGTVLPEPTPVDGLAGADPGLPAENPGRAGDAGHPASSGPGVGLDGVGAPTLAPTATVVATAEPASPPRGVAGGGGTGTEPLR